MTNTQTPKDPKTQAAEEKWLDDLAAWRARRSSPAGMTAKDSNILVIVESSKHWLRIAEKLEAISPEVFEGWELSATGVTTIGLLQFHRITDDADARALARAFGGDWVDDGGGCWKSQNTILGPGWAVYLHKAENTARPKRHIDLSLPASAVHPACGDS